MADSNFAYLGVPAEVRTALTALCTEYVWRVDNGHADRAPELFTFDGAWIGPWGTVKGQAELKAAFDARAQRTIRTRHMQTNLHFTLQAPDRAAGQASQIVFAADGDAPFPVRPNAVAEYLDEYERGADGVWRLLSRRVAMLADEIQPKK